MNTDKFVEHVSMFIDLYENDVDINAIFSVYENHYKLPISIVYEIADTARELLDYSIKWEQQA